MRRSIVASSLLLSAAFANAAMGKTPAAGRWTGVSAVAASPGKPKIGTFGFDESGMDPTVRPGNDFASYAGGTWEKNTEIPADHPIWGMFNVLQDVSNEQTRAILDEAARTQGSKIGDMYASFMDEAAANSKGIEPVRPWLAKIAAVQDKTALAAEIAELTRYGVPGIFGIGVGQDSKDPQTYVVNLAQSGLGLPDRDYYLKNDPKLADTREKYKAYIATMLGFAGSPDAAVRANAIFDFEKAIAQVHWSRIESRDADKRYNKLTFAEIEAKAPGFPWSQYLSQTGMAGRPYYIVGQPSAVAGQARVFADTPLPVLKDYMTFRVLRAYANYLSKPLVDANFAFNGTVLAGTPQQQLRWKRGVAATSGALGEEIGKTYVARYFPPASKAAIDQLVKNIIGAMGVRLDKLQWMAPETKIKAHEKLAAFTPKIGYPSVWRDYSTLQIRRNDLVGNVAASNAFEYQRNLNKLDKPIDRTEWGMTPMTINAYANPVMNEIVFPAAILQAPFFDAKADPAINYGGIGVVIGHELSHHFDDQGRKYDKTGKLTEWWTKDDVARFTALTDKLVKQYDAYEPIPGQHIQGGLTLGENMADLAGLAVAYDAYHRSLNGKPAPVIDGLTGDHRFYLGYAQVWRTKFREPALRSQLLSDPHSPGKFRTAEVRNIDAWYQAFHVQPGDALYLAPTERVRVW
jgi:putative endopeptidase